MSYLKQFTKILRGSLTASPSSASGGSTGTFHLPLRKLVLRYSQHNPSSSGLRSFLLSSKFSSLTQTYPTVEFVVDQAGREKHPLVTGFYAQPGGVKANQGENQRRKDINLANLDANQVEAKIKQVVESSGNKIKALKRRPVVSKSEAARGVWSQLHDKPVDI
ncbi:related to MRPL51 - mitochondrial ribosomal protein, large subunit [Ustilago trichophora]|uniref:Large ribosomal subunit protein mL43 n=1 Tax=Ustilago trichophora TaxID=86804 RepID=A0A5C3E761_9BASI|nr:related to MRPL51 - mitochondrial ribosomal protein, large subunit [Ustilago trichophora]